MLRSGRGLLVVALLVLCGCPYGQTRGPSLSERLDFRIDTAALPERGSRRIERIIEDLLRENDVVARAQLVDERTIHVTLPAGPATIPWLALLRNPLLEMPRPAPRGATAFDLRLHADWRAHYQKAAYAAVAAQVMRRLTLLGLAAQTKLDGDTLHVDVQPLDAAQRQRLRQLLVRSPQLALRVVRDDSAPTQDDAGQPVARDERIVPVIEPRLRADGSSVDERYYGALDPAPLRLFVAAVSRHARGDHQLLIGPTRLHDQPAARTFDVELGTDDMDGEDIRDDGNVKQDQDGYTLRLRMTPAGAQRLAALTSSNVGRRVAIVVDGIVLTSFVVPGPVVGGVMQLRLNVDTVGLDTVRLFGLGALALPIAPID